MGSDTKCGSQSGHVPETCVELLDVRGFSLAGEVRQGGKRKEMTIAIPRLHVGLRDVVAVIGGSGCGKSVLLSLVMGYPSFGVGGRLRAEEFSLFGEQMPESAFRHAECAALWRRRFSRSGGLFYLPQSFPLAKTAGGNTRTAMLQVVQALAAPKRISVREASDRLVRTFAKHGMRDVLGKNLDDLSGGERRRAELLARLVAIKAAARPAILVLDEPTTGFDPDNAQRFIKDVRAVIDELCAEGIPAAAMLSTHEMRSLDDRLPRTDGAAPSLVVDRVCVVNRDSDGPGSDICTVVFDGGTDEVFPHFFGMDAPTERMTFAADGENLFRVIRGKKSEEWLKLIV